ncbi:MAG: hypothetical protein K8T25_09410 [Planctomycetia bacterium]|nr:hypothetical protein [Planctomycetia bacterium]
MALICLTYTTAALAVPPNPPERPKVTPKAAADKEKADKEDAAKAKKLADNQPPPKPAPDSPAVAAIRESNPTAPADLIRAIDALLALDATPLAKDYLKRLIATPLDKQQLAALGEEAGADRLFRIAQAAALRPTGQQFANSVFEAIREVQNDPRRLEKLVDGLKSAADADRAASAEDLIRVGQASVGPLARVLADPVRQSQHVEARKVLIALGPQAVEPLLAVLDGADAATQAEVIGVLYQLNDPRSTAAMLAMSAAPSAAPRVQKLASAAVERQLGTVPDRTAVAKHLENLTREYLRGTRHVVGDENNLADVWQWNAQSGELTKSRLAVDAASAMYAAWLGRRLRDVSPQSDTAEAWHLLSGLQAAKLIGGIGQPLSQGPGQAALAKAAAHGPDALRNVLSRALTENYVPAALAAVEILGNARDPKLLANDGSGASPLARAANHPDRRLRLAALGAIAALRPTQSFAGAAAVSRELKYFAHYDGLRRAVVADPRADRAHALGALLDECGFATAICTTGREAFQAASAESEVEFLLVVWTVENPRADELVRQLRRDPRTARLPIGLIAATEHLFRAEGLALTDPLVKVFVRPRDLATMRERVAQLIGLSGVDYVPPAERQAEAVAALTILADLTAQRQPLFDLSGVDLAVEPDLYVPATQLLAMKVLAQLGTPKAQKALVAFASTDTQPIAARKAAAAAFADSLRGHGIRLSIAEIQEQSHRYDQSSGRDKQSQDVLWSLLDALQKIKKEQPGQVPPPPPPVRVTK